MVKLQLIGTLLIWVKLFHIDKKPEFVIDEYLNLESLIEKNRPKRSFV